MLIILLTKLKKMQKKNSVKKESFHFGKALFYTVQ